MATSIQFLRHPLALLASLWDTPPTITAPVALPSATPIGASTASPVVEMVLAPKGVCGWVQAEAATGVTRTFVCRALGQTMPAVVFFVSAAVLVVTILFLFRYLIRAQAALSTIAALQKDLGHVPKASAFDWPTREEGERVITALQGRARRLPPLGPFGERVRQAIEPVKSSAPVAPISGEAPVGKVPESIMLERPVSDLLGGRSGLDSWTGKQLADALPGWLTAIGLLTTFIAILLGLQSVTVMSDLEVRGIAGLVNGLSGKFCSSIVALGCATSVSIVNHFVGIRLHDDWSATLRGMERRLPHLSVERLLVKLMAKPRP